VIQSQESDPGRYRFELTHRAGASIPLFILSYLRKEAIDSPNVFRQLLFDQITISSEEGKEMLAEWLLATNGDTQKAVGITNLHLAAYEARMDVSNAYPDILQNDNLGFREWFRSFGITELKADTFLPATTLERFLDHDRKLLQDRQNRESYDLAVVGYLSRSLGIGEDARRILNAAKNSIKGTVIGFDYERSESEVQYPDYQSVSSFGRSKADISIVCVNADNLEQFDYEFPTVLSGSKFKVGRWAWELDEMPSWMSGRQHLLDELWVCSGFIANVLRKSVAIPVHVVPPVLFNGEDEVDLESQQSVTFLYIFDYLSGFERKNPLGLVRAFKQAFPVEGSARLILKSINSSARFVESEQLRFAIKDRSDIELIDRYLDVQEMNELYARASCYVSLHRSEGVGLTMAEAMARGIPVIATGYGGNLEFMDGSVALINSYGFVKVGEGNVPYPADSIWAEPDYLEAAALMELIASNKGLRVEIGLAGRNHIRKNFDEHAIAVLLKRNIRRISKHHSLGRR
jgi:glycosyltransferase involved in cell wall biosynthesis